MNTRRGFRRQYLIGALQTVALLAALVFVTFTAARILLGSTAAMVAIVSFAVVALVTMENRRILMPTGSRLITNMEAPELLSRLRWLSQRAGLERAPQLYLVPSPVANAVTTGGSHNAVIVVTSELLRRLSLREITAVIAHEIAHIRNGDLYLFALSNAIRSFGRLIVGFTVAVLIVSFPILALTGSFVPPQVLLFLAAAPIVGLFAQLAIMRTREFHADLVAAAMAEDPDGLASALRRLEQKTFRVLDWLMPRRPRQREQGIGDLLRSHPDTDERVRRLQNLSDEPLRIHVF